MEKTCKLTVVGQRCQMVLDLVVNEGITAGALLQKLRLPDFSLFRLDGKTGLMVQPAHEVYPLVQNGGELIAAKIACGPEPEDS